MKVVVFLFFILVCEYVSSNIANHAFFKIICGDILFEMNDSHLISTIFVNFSRNFRPSWKYNDTEAVAGNYYPVDSRIYIRVRE